MISSPEKGCGGGGGDSGEGGDSRGGGDGGGGLGFVKSASVGIGGSVGGVDGGYVGRALQERGGVRA